MGFTPIKRLVLILSILSLGPVCAAATYSFSECLEIIKKNNGELQAAQESVQAAKDTLSASYSGFLPQVSANLSYNRGQTENNNAEGYNANLSATETLFNGFSDVAKISDAEGKLKAAQAQLQITLAKLSFDLKSAFAGVLYAQDSLKLSKSIEKRRSDNLNLVRLRFQSGRENKGSVLLSEAYLKQARLDVLKAQHSLDTAQATLVRVLGLPPEESVEITGTVPELTRPAQTPVFLDLAEKTPDIRQSQAQLQSAEAGLTTSRSNFYPTLSLKGSVGKNGEDFFPENDLWSVGATLSWSLFSGGRDYFTQKSSFAQKLVAENSLRNLRLDLIAKLRDAYAGFIEAVEDVSVSAAFAEAATTRAEIARSKYNNGLSSFDDWDIIENDLITRQKDLTLKRRDRVIAEATWQKTQGVGELQ